MGFDAEALALALARRVVVAVAEVPVLAQQRPGRTVRAPASGRRELTSSGDLWAAGHTPRLLG